MSPTGSRPTMRRVAEVAGVSPMTVSYVFSQPDRVAPETAEKVRAAAQRLGYPGPHPTARSLRRGRAGSLGVVLGEPLTYAFEDPQAARFLAGVAEVCAAGGVGLSLVPITGAASDAERVAGAVVDGFVVWTTSEDDPVLDAVAATGLPAAVHAGPPGAGLQVVGIDDRAAARAIGQVTFTDARRAVVLSFPTDRDRRRQQVAGSSAGPMTFPVTRHRWEGFRDAWEQTGSRLDHLTLAVCARNSAAEGEAAIADLLARSEAPEAIAAMSDELAVGAMRAIASAGLAVPDAVAISGWDDGDVAARAGLTTVAQSLRDQGARCARLALGRPAESQDGEPEWRVVVRSTTRPAQPIALTD